MRPFHRVSSRCGRWCLLGLLLAGCGYAAPTEVARDNRKLVDAILTAIAMKNLNWLDDDAKLAKKRHEDGQITDWEYQQLASVIEKAKTLDWQAAEKMGYDFRKVRPFVKDGQ